MQRHFSALPLLDSFHRTREPQHNIRDQLGVYLLFGFCGITLDRLSCHQALQRILDRPDPVRLDVQLQGEERLQSGRLL